MASPGGGPRRIDEIDEADDPPPEGARGLRSSVRKAAGRIPGAPFPFGLPCGVVDVVGVVDFVERPGWVRGWDGGGAAFTEFYEQYMLILSKYQS